MPYAISMPFSVHLDQPLPDDRHFILFVASCPLSAKETLNFTWNARNYELNPSPDARSPLLHAREDARGLPAEALRVTPEELVLVRNTTEGSNFAYGGALELRRRSRRKGSAMTRRSLPSSTLSSSRAASAAR